MNVQRVHVGYAGWSIPKELSHLFAAEGTHLARYAQRLSAVEINSSFYRPHRPQTYAKWAASVPDSFRFSIKVPKEITHQRRLQDCDELLAHFLAEVNSLGEKRGPLLIQLPPSLAFAEKTVSAFFSALRSRCDWQTVCEPRHVSWLSAAADELLASFEVSRVAADPALAPGLGQPGGWSGFVYYRLHGFPEIYYSSYSDTFLAELTGSLREADAPEAWCIFDNTATGAATQNALRFSDLINQDLR